MSQLSEDEINKLLDEMDEMLENGGAEIIFQNDDMMLIRRADGSGLMLAPGFVVNVRSIAPIDEDLRETFRRIADRKPDNEANDLLSQIFDNEESNQ